MYKVEEDNFIDWDAAHCLSEGDFSPEVEKRLVVYLGSSNVTFSSAHDLLYVNVLFQEPDNAEEEKDDWEALASGDKESIDSAFRRLLGKQLTK